MLADRLSPLSYDSVNDGVKKGLDEGTYKDKDEEGIFKNYLHFFKVNTFYID